MEKGNPEEIVAATFADLPDDDHEYRLGRAKAAIVNLNEAGWRIVQTETLHGAELDHDGLEVARIDQEWTP